MNPVPGESQGTGVMLSKGYFMSFYVVGVSERTSLHVTNHCLGMLCLQKSTHFHKDLLYSKQMHFPESRSTSLEAALDPAHEMFNALLLIQ